MKHKIKGHRAEHSVDMSIEWTRQSRIALIGQSGAGKTTLLRSIAGFESELNEQGDLTGLKPWQRSVSYLHQHPVMFMHQTVAQSFNFAKTRRQKTRLNLPYEKWMSWLDIQSLLTKPCSKLSGGQQQRVSILRALYSQPSFLLMDETFTSLDNERLLQACRVIDEYCQLTEAGFILASHQDKPMRILCNEAIKVEHLKTQPKQPLFDVINQQQGDQLKTTLVCHCESEVHQFLLSNLAGQPIYSEQPQQWKKGPARFTLDAHAVSISLAERAQTSLVNRLSVTIGEHQPHGADHYRVWLEIGDEGFWSVVSHWSWQRLNLFDGQSVFAEFKVGALEWTGQLAQ